MSAFVHNDSKTMTLSETEIRLKNGARIIQETPCIFDHFTYGAGAFNSHVPQYWVTTETGSATAFAPSATGVGGHAVGVTGATTNNAQEFAGKMLSWQPSTQALKGPLVLEVRLSHRSTTAANGDLGVGFNDATTEASGLSYVLSAASAVTTHAPSDFAGFWYTSIATSGALFVTGGNPYGVITTIADVDTVTAPDTTNRVIKHATNFVKLRVELDSSGNAKFFANEKWQASVASAVTAASLFTPYIDLIGKASEAHTGTLDYIFVGGDLL